MCEAMMVTNVQYQNVSAVPTAVTRNVGSFFEKADLSLSVVVSKRVYYLHIYSRR